MSSTVHGIVAYPVTPFRPATYEVDHQQLAVLVDRLVRDGAHAIAPLGSTGESAYLSDSEWADVAATSIDATAGRVPTVVGVSALTTAATTERARIAARLGADMVMVLPMSYWKLAPEEVRAHIAAVGASTDLPIMVYNNPATSGIDLSPEFLVDLVETIPNVVAIKESSGDITRMQRIARLGGGEVPFFNGSNPLAFLALAAGATGWCTAAPALCPRHVLDLHDAVADGDLGRARALSGTLLPLLEFILARGLPTAVKAGLAELGVDAGVPRLPLQPLDAAGTEQLRTLLSDLDITAADVPAAS
ncbi:dihydrodipicolinate synthase family protein [Saccharopolyspora sp. NPDC047091]|uniref:dihydrodipicolinate synthase family protein n=1 Tax=Saccharopolyspora sp. NPDC047091 TaxID=3155924 RepID=UPI00340F4B56